MLFNTSRMWTVRGLAPGFADGISGASTVHSASVKSLGYRFLFIAFYVYVLILPHSSSAPDPWSIPRRDRLATLRNTL